MSNSLDFRRQIPIKYDVDVFIAGGGTAGVVAAVAAAREGASVYLAESQAMLGGTGTSGMIPSYMQFTDGINFLPGYIGQEIFDALYGDESKTVARYRHIDTEKLKRVYDKLLCDAKVKFTFLTNLIGIEKEGSSIKYAVLSSKSGIFAVKAKIYIDCTGDGDLSFMAGAKFHMGDEDGKVMSATLCSRWVNVDYTQMDLYENNKYLQQAFDDGVFSVNDPSLPGITQQKYSVGGGNVGHEFGVDATDEQSYTHAIINARKRLLEYEKFYRNYVNGCEDVHLFLTASMLGIRESRRIVGDYILNLDDYIKRASFEDEIGRYCYPVDIHSSMPDDPKAKDNDEFYEKGRYQKGESYGVPYRILTPIGFDNLLVAGRCVSCDRSMLGSIRVMPGCYITGQAAGVAAGIAVKNKTHVRGFEIRMLQKRLKQLGVYLPNCDIEN